MPDLNTTDELTAATDPIKPYIAETPVVEVTPKQKEEFFKSFLADKPYREEISLLNGNYRAVFKTLSMKENTAILRQIAFDREAGRIDGASDYYFSRVAHYRLSLALELVNDKPFAEGITDEKCPADVKTGESYISKRVDIIAGWNMVKLASLQSELVKFDQRVVTLMNSVANPDFWKAAA